jgi:heme-degrading monooxygenase HmoA
MSYARIVTVHAQAGKVDEVVKIYQDSIVPAIKGQKGYKGSRLFIDHASNKGVSVTRWASKEDLEATEASGIYQAQVAKLAGLLAGAPEREAYEIAVEDE